MRWAEIIYGPTRPISARKTRQAPSPCKPRLENSRASTTETPHHTARAARSPKRNSITRFSSPKFSNLELGTLASYSDRIADSPAPLAPRRELQVRLVPPQIRTCHFRSSPLNFRGSFVFFRGDFISFWTSCSVVSVVALRPCLDPILARGRRLREPGHFPAIFGSLACLFGACVLTKV